jgi:hypothetical protein
MPIGHRAVLRSSLPPVQWRAINRSEGMDRVNALIHTYHELEWTDA